MGKWCAQAGTPTPVTLKRDEMVLSLGYKTIKTIKDAIRKDEHTTQISKTVERRKTNRTSKREIYNY